MTAAMIAEQRIILLNADGDMKNPLSANLSVQKAARLLARGKVEIEDWVEDKYLGPWFWPKVLRLREYVYIAWEKLHGAPTWSKRGVLIRDNRVCAYCGGHATTIDHVHPRSKGGPNTWANTVSACQPCNHRKGNKTLAEARMKLLWEPYIPKRTQLR